MTNSGATPVDHLQLKVGVEGYAHVSETFSVAAGQSEIIPVVIGGYGDLPDLASLWSAAERMAGVPVDPLGDRFLGDV